MTAGNLESAILTALAGGPAPAWALAERLGVSVARVEPLLRDLRAQGLVAVEEGPDGVRRWRLAGGPIP